MSKAIAVIGANYGDEGKGLTVDYLARNQAAKGQSPLIVRFNGGAQAGHTVVTPNGQRHVFSHLGAASFLSAARTYLSSKFIVNPYTLKKELFALKGQIDSPVIYVHPHCMVTTVYDMAINSIAELSRGQQRHGSCGMGINETVTRSLSGFPLKLFHVQKLSVQSLAQMLEGIATRWVPARLEALGLGEAELSQHHLFSAILTETADFTKQAENLKELITPMIMLDKASLNEMISSIEPGQDVIMEGAQGLALDEHLGSFPYVTRSVTGLLGAMAVAAYELNITEVEPLYITRAYLTRHGAGPMPFENEPITDKPLYEMTNVENMWQGSLRKAPLNIQQLKKLIEADLARSQASPAKTAMNVSLSKAQMMVTCLDQLGEETYIVNADGQMTKILSADLPLTLARELGRDVTVSLCSYGPTAANVKSWS